MNLIIRLFTVDNISSHQMCRCPCLFFDQEFVNYFIELKKLLLIFMENYGIPRRGGF